MTRTLVPKLVTKELGDIKKAEEKEEVKEKELRNQVMAISEEVKENTNMNVPGSSVCLNSATSNFVLKSIL